MNQSVKSARTTDLDSPERYDDIKDCINKKVTLKKLYREVYQKYQECIDRSPRAGEVLEIGSGAGFAKEVIPHIVTSDVVAYTGVDKVLDATQMDFPVNSLSCICMYNVLHHIPNTPAFFSEVNRCLKSGGRVFMTEPYPGWIGAWIYKYIHHEDYDPHVESWEFKSTGPVSSANNALPYVIFERDMDKFRCLYPELSIVRFEPHTPLRYWLTGGLKRWSLLPAWAFKVAGWLDRLLIKISPNFGSFVDIELVKK